MEFKTESSVYPRPFDVRKMFESFFILIRNLIPRDKIKITELQLQTLRMSYTMKICVQY